MFGTFIKYSLLSIIILLATPVVIFFVLYYYVISPFVLEATIAIGKGAQTFFQSEGTTFLLLSMFISILLNFIFLVLLPGTYRPLDPNTKRKQFFFGFISNLILMFVIPVIYMLIYKLNWESLIVLAALHSLGLLLPFILGAYFVCPAYANKFWFKDRIKKVND